MTRPKPAQSVLRHLPVSDRDEVSSVMSRIVDGLDTILRDQLIGIYLYGSLVTGDFEADVSDIDLVVLLAQPLDKRHFTRLRQFHADVVRAHPAWNDRLELAYISARGLRDFRRESSIIGIMSPGEPFHLVQAGDDWLISWYALRENGIALHGPPVETMIDPMPKADWLVAVRDHICAYHGSVQQAQDKASLSYVVLTVARGLYTLTHRRDASKVKAATWLAAANPRWASLIQRALQYRRNPAADSMPPDQLRPQVKAYLRDLLPGATCGED